LKLIEISKIFFHENQLIYVDLTVKQDKNMKNLMFSIFQKMAFFSYFWQNTVRLRTNLDRTCTFLVLVPVPVPVHVPVHVPVPVPVPV
jgi:hypothetical protein